MAINSNFRHLATVPLVENCLIEKTSLFFFFCRAEFKVILTYKKQNGSHVIGHSVCFINILNIQMS